MIMRKPARTTAWSSTNITRIGLFTGIAILKRNDLALALEPRVLQDSTSDRLKRQLLNRTLLNRTLTRKTREIADTAIESRVSWTRENARCSASDRTSRC